MESAKTLATGTVLGARYRVERLLGEGGMGAVYEGQHMLTRRRVALKVLSRELDSSGVFAQRFFQEAQAAASVEHPNIVGVLDMGVDAGGVLFLVLEYFAGEDLAALMARVQRLPPGDAVALLLPVMQALCVAHQKGIIHRDLKPGNVFLARSESGDVTPKLLDFGISKVQGEQSLARTSTGLILGTPNYMSPEQARGAKALDHRVDIWSMGVMFYELLSGSLPFDGDNYNELMFAIVGQEPVPLTERVPTLDPALAAVIRRAMAKNAGDRFASMDAFVEALAPFAAPQFSRTNTGRFSAMVAPTASTIEPSVTGPMVPAPGLAEGDGSRTTANLAWTNGAQQAAAKPRRSPLGIAVAGVALVAVVGIGVLSLSRATPAPAREAATPATRTEAAATPPTTTLPTTLVAPAPAAPAPAAATTTAPAPASPAGPAPATAAPPAPPVVAAPVTAAEPVAPRVAAAPAPARPAVVAEPRATRETRATVRRPAAARAPSGQTPSRLGWGQE